RTSGAAPSVPCAAEQREAAADYHGTEQGEEQDPRAGPAVAEMRQGLQGRSTPRRAMTVVLVRRIREWPRRAKPDVVRPSAVAVPPGEYAAPPRLLPGRERPGSSRRGSGSGGGLCGVLHPAPAVPALDLDPGADPGAFQVRVRVAGVVPREAVDVGQVLVVPHLGDAADQGDVGVPVVLGQHGEGDARVAAQVLQADAALVEVEQDAAVLPQVP